MISDFIDIDTLASTGEPLGLVAMAADEREFLLTLKTAHELGYIRPCIIGSREKLKRAAHSIEFDISDIEVIEEKEPQAIADKGIEMLYSGQADIPMKGHIPTSYVYRSIIRKEKAQGGKETISVNTFWDVPGVNHLVSITDTGVTINPDLKTKRNIILDAVQLMHILGYDNPRVGILSGPRDTGSEASSYNDALALKQDALQNVFGECTVLEATSLARMLMPAGDLLETFEQIDLGMTPHILVVPHLDAGNILS
jgi:phosphotransacetylase